MQSGASASGPSAGVRGVLVMMLVVCLVECTTGSCLSYGHSCWGATQIGASPRSHAVATHGKRSGKPPVSAPDWYITRILRRMATSSELNRAKHLENENEDAIYRVDDDTPSSIKFMSDSEEAPAAFTSKGPEAKPMLDEDVLSKMKLWQIMRAASEN